MSDKNRTVIYIDGREYAMVSVEPPEYVHRVAAYVNRRIEEMKVSSKLSSVMLAVLAALNITDELFKTQTDNARMRKDLADTRQQLAILERELAAAREDRQYRPPEIVPLDAAINEHEIDEHKKEAK